MASVQPSAPRAIADCGVLIVGGTSGVGRAAARAFVAAGAPRLALVGRNRDRGAAVRDELRELADSEVEFVAADVSDAAGALEAATEAHGHLRHIDVLINAAAGAHLPNLLHRNQLEKIPGIVADLILPPLLMTCAVLPWMRSQSSGCIINVASDAAKVPTPGESIIGAAMAAIVTFSRTLAMEAKRDGIRVNVLTPSLVEGTGTAERLFADDFSARLFGRARELAHLGVSTADDQAALMVYLAGPHGQRITGQAISVNGGISSA
jgi:2-hydroxycyclohexanecarboxyl-CoA dehydrogenase